VSRVAPPFDLSGVWVADDGGVYSLTQVGGEVRWTEVSPDARGEYANVFEGTWQLDAGYAGAVDWGRLSGFRAAVSAERCATSGNVDLSVVDLRVMNRDELRGRVGFGPFRLRRAAAW
jgi:hypothetical protein